MQFCSGGIHFDGMTSRLPCFSQHWFSLIFLYFDIVWHRKLTARFSVHINYRVTTLQLEKSPTFPDEIADNMSNKRTFINIKSACYEVWVAFQLLTKVNSKR